jgi:hypothetical protein
MKSKFVVFSLFAISLAGSALADAGNYPEPYLAKSEGPGRSRAEVIAEVMQARREGKLEFAENEFPSSVHSVSSKSRAEVIAEWKEAQRLGLLQNGEGGSQFASVEQNEQIAAAGRRAAEAVHLAGK